MKLLRVIAVLLVLGLIGLGMLGRYLYTQWEQPLSLPQEGMVFTVASGDSLRTVAGRLADRGVLDYPQLLIAYGRWSGLDSQIKRGEYHLPVGLTAEAALALFCAGEVTQYQVTLPEGITLQRALEILHSQEALTRELTGADDPKVLALVKPHASPEGLFFPDSYRYSRGDSDWDLLQRAFDAMQQVLGSQWETRAKNLPYETPYDALIMASIVERETGLVSERETIAGVFVRRLRKGMLLQTDPTIIYGLGEHYDGNIRRSHLKDPSNPYNTYQHRGLPPSPIALPGKGAIHAAMHPAAGKALYFVARGDGGHVFSATLAQHNAAVRKYQLRRKANYRSSPPATAQ